MWKKKIWTKEKIKEAFFNLKEELGYTPGSDEFKEKYKYALRTINSGRIPGVKTYNEFVESIGLEPKNKTPISKEELYSLVIKCLKKQDPQTYVELGKKTGLERTQLEPVKRLKGIQIYHMNEFARQITPSHYLFKNPRIIGKAVIYIKEKKLAEYIFSQINPEIFKNKNKGRKRGLVQRINRSGLPKKAKKRLEDLLASSA